MDSGGPLHGTIANVSTDKDGTTHVTLLRDTGGHQTDWLSAFAFDDEDAARAALVRFAQHAPLTKD